jgi:hypothetical protein
MVYETVTPAWVERLARPLGLRCVRLTRWASQGAPPILRRKNPHARKGRIPKRSHGDLPCPDGTAKINRFCSRWKQWLFRAVPPRQEGRMRNRHETWGGMQWTRLVSSDERCRTRTVKACGPDIPTLISSLPRR